MVKDGCTRRYHITHRTHYDYSNESSLCHNQLHLAPRDLPHQHVEHAWIEIEPAPACRFQWRDTFDNPVEFFSIEQVHSSMTVTSRCVVERTCPVRPTSCGQNWIDLAAAIRTQNRPDMVEATEYLFDSRFCQRAPEFEQYARARLDPNIDAVDALLALNQRIHSEFTYMPESTHVTTPPSEVLQKKRGVCQDFAHVLICCLRSVGIPSRYVSGYLLTQPPPGRPRLIGADASHAWVSAFAGDAGWIDLDPTNNMTPGTDHITVAWGRDYADVAPIQGVFVGGGYTSLHVSVDVMLANDSPGE